MTHRKLNSHDFHASSVSARTCYPLRVVARVCFVYICELEVCVEMTASRAIGSVVHTLAQTFSIEVGCFPRHTTAAALLFVSEIVSIQHYRDSFRQSRTTEEDTLNLQQQSILIRIISTARSCPLPASDTQYSHVIMVAFAPLGPRPLIQASSLHTVRPCLTALVISAFDRVSEHAFTAYSIGRARY